MNWVEILFSHSFRLALVGMMIAVAIEAVGARERYSLRDRVPGLLMHLTSGILMGALAWPVQRLWESIGLRDFIIPLWPLLAPLGAAGAAVQFLLLILIADFLAYWRHRMEHSRYWWPVHKVHHSPRQLHAANDLGHPLQWLFSFVWITVPMSLFRVDGPTTPVAVSLTVVFLSYYVHSPTDFHFGPLRRVLVDNRFHRIHHSLEVHHLEKNFGICFSLWDGLFGTAYWPAPDEWPKVGVEGIMPPRTVREFLAMPFLDIVRVGVSPALAQRPGGDGILRPGRRPGS